ncbi:MAG TPA: hypothetical protein VIP46_08680, partial [Pyrinomonadaceae bacterium]
MIYSAPQSSAVSVSTNNSTAFRAPPGRRGATPHDEDSTMTRPNTFKAAALVLAAVAASALVWRAG